MARLILIYRCYGEFAKRTLRQIGVHDPATAENRMTYFNGSVELAAIIKDGPGRFQAFVEQDILDNRDVLPRRYLAIPADAIEYIEASPAKRPVYDLEVWVGAEESAASEPVALEDPPKDPGPPDESDADAGGADDE